MGTQKAKHCQCEYETAFFMDKERWQNFYHSANQVFVSDKAFFESISNTLTITKDKQFSRKFLLNFKNNLKK